MNNNTLEENQKIIDDYINKNKKSYNVETTEVEFKVLTKEQKAIEMLKDRLFTLEDKVYKLESIIVGLQTGCYSNTKSQENKMMRESLIKAIDDFYENTQKEII